MASLLFAGFVSDPLRGLRLPGGYSVDLQLQTDVVIPISSPSLLFFVRVLCTPSL